MISPVGMQSNATPMYSLFIDILILLSVNRCLKTASLLSFHSTHDAKVHILNVKSLHVFSHLLASVGPPWHSSRELARGIDAQRLRRVWLLLSALHARTNLSTMLADTNSSMAATSDPYLGGNPQEVREITHANA